jgi:hypothetical protein
MVDDSDDDFEDLDDEGDEEQSDPDVCVSLARPLLFVPRAERVIIYRTLNLKSILRHSPVVRPNDEERHLQIPMLTRKNASNSDPRRFWKHSFNDCPVPSYIPLAQVRTQ